MKIKKKHVGQELVYIGESIPAYGLNTGDMVTLLLHKYKMCGERFCQITNEAIRNNKISSIFIMTSELSLSTTFPLDPPLFTGDMIEGMADKVIEFQKYEGKVIFPDESVSSLFTRDVVEVSGPHGTISYHASESIPRDTVEASGPYGTLKANIANESDFDGMPSQTVVFCGGGGSGGEKPFYSWLPDFMLAHEAPNASINKENAEPSKSTLLDQETADAIKAMVDKMVGKRLVDFGVGYASIDITDESVNPKRLINSISIKVE